ncbi:protein kinase domain-containing protein [Actinoplanes sp. CA-131856]
MATSVLAGRYRLIQPIGTGGMGVVWEARDELLDRDVAVKELTPGGLTAEELGDLRERAIREARAIARVDDANVVKIFDVVHEDDAPWIVMEIVRSRALHDVINEDGPMAPEQAAEVGLAVLAGLRAVHAAGILHRDVKPANVLLGLDGRVVLTDFGLAAMTGDSAMTRTGVVLGSPSYLAPERALDEEPGPAADLWSLGATLYAAVEGRPPFEKSSPMATLAALMVEAPAPPKQAGALGPVLDALLRKDPAERADADEAERLLRAAASEAPAAVAPAVSAPPVASSAGVPATAPADAAAEPVGSPADPPTIESPGSKGAPTVSSASGPTAAPPSATPAEAAPTAKPAEIPAESPTVATPAAPIAPSPAKAVTAAKAATAKPGATAGKAAAAATEADAEAEPAAADDKPAKVVEVAVAAATTATLSPAPARRRTRRRWWATAAAFVVVVGGTAWPLIAQARGDDTAAASSIELPSVEASIPAAAGGPAAPPATSSSAGPAPSLSGVPVATRAGSAPAAGVPAAPAGTQGAAAPAGTAAPAADGGTTTTAPAAAPAATTKPAAIKAPVATQAPATHTTAPGIEVWNHETHTCLDGRGSAVQLWACDSSDAQRFDFRSDGTMRVRGWCVRLDGSGNGARLVLAGCDGSSAQKFDLNVRNDLVSLKVDKCVDVPDGNPGNGVPAQIWDCAGTDNQKWN